jgi:glucokinase
MKDIDLLFERLSKSGFRSGFELKGRELEYLNT